MRIALVSRNSSKFSETFIDAQRRNLPGQVLSYYGTRGDMSLDPSGRLLTKTNLPRYFIEGALKRKKDIMAFAKRQAFKSSLKKNKIDVILINFGNTAAELVDVLAESKIPFVVIFHGYDATRFDIVAAHKKNFLRVFERASSIIGVSKAIGSKLEALGCPKEKIRYNPCPPDDAFQRIKSDLSERKAVCIGRFVDKKAPYYVVLAFAEVIKSIPDAKLWYFGDGPLLNATRNLVKHLGITENIILFGRIPPNDYVEHLRTARVYVQHSIQAEDGDTEGTPVAIQEASAAGIPVVSTIHAGIPDVIDDGATGFLVCEHDVHSMADRIVTLMSDLSLARTMGEAGKSRMARFFTMERHIRDLTVELESAIAAKSTHSG